VLLVQPRKQFPSFINQLVDAKLGPNGIYTLLPRFTNNMQRMKFSNVEQVIFLAFLAQRMGLSAFAFLGHENALKFHPDNKYLQDRMSAALLQIEEGSGAYGLFEKVINAPKNNDGSLYQATQGLACANVIYKAFILKNAGQYAEALKIINDNLAIFPDLAEMFTSRGIILHRMKKYEEALESIKTKGDNKAISWCNLIIFAKNNAVSVYCCDLTLFTSYDEYQGKSEYEFHTKKEEFHIDPDVYMDQLKSTTTSKHSRRYKRDMQSAIEKNHCTGKGVMIRNQYAGKIIEQFTDNFSPLEMQNSILFGGIDHFQCPDDNNSLHTLCHIDQSKIIDFSSRAWIQKETNTQKSHANSAGNNKLHTFFYLIK
jgi:tetratricopeptide (TPR) repeat protein